MKKRGKQNVFCVALGIKEFDVKYDSWNGHKINHTAWLMDMCPFCLRFLDEKASW